MQAPNHPLTELFNQLGLPSDDSAIEAFIARYGNLPHTISLADAQFWTPSQANFLRQELLLDADWAHVVDELNVRLHEPS